MGGKTSNESKAKYNAKAYDRINIAVPKGQKEVIQAHAAAVGMSVNAYINQAIQAYMGRGNAPEPAPNAPVSPSDGVVGGGGTETPRTPENVSSGE